MAWKNEIQADNSGTWSTNALRFATKEEAEAYGLDLFKRWTLVQDYRATETDESVNYRFVEGRAVPIVEAA